MHCRDVYILGGLRSHLGLKNGIFKTIPPETLGAALLRRLFIRFPESKEAELVIGGNAVGPGGNLSRLTALLAGLAETVPALTVDMQCASALESILLGYAKIRAGMHDVILCGGVESTSLQPKKTYQPWDPRYTPDGFYTAQFSPDTISQRVMLEGAERTAQVYGVNREKLDFWAVRSHEKVRAALENGSLQAVVEPLFGSTRDESMRRNMNEKWAGRMPTLFTPAEVEQLLTAPEKKDKQDFRPTLTAANACLLQDGAAYVVLCSGVKLLEWKKAGKIVHPWGKILGGEEIGVNPRFSPLGALAAGEKVLQKAQLTMDDMDTIEYNEAFAVISALFARKYPSCLERYLPFGGALAYGHPYGCSGAVLVLHALCALKEMGGKRALCAIAGAGGTGCGLLLERVEA